MDELKTEHEKQNRLRREFTANVSHELKTPLTSISGYAEIMRNGFAKPEDISRFSGIIYDETHYYLEKSLFYLNDDCWFASNGANGYHEVLSD